MVEVTELSVCKAYCGHTCSFVNVQETGTPSPTPLKGQLCHTDMISSQRQPTVWIKRTNMLCEISQIQLHMTVSNYIKYKNRKISSMPVEVRILVTLGERELMTKKAQGATEELISFLDLNADYICVLSV